MNFEGEYGKAPENQVGPYDPTIFSLLTKVGKHLVTAPDHTHPCGERAVPQSLYQ
jgi:hypothetical protein